MSSICEGCPDGAAVHEVAESFNARMAAIGQRAISDAAELEETTDRLILGTASGTPQSVLEAIGEITSAGKTQIYAAGLDTPRIEATCPGRSLLGQCNVQIQEN